MARRFHRVLLPCQQGADVKDKIDDRLAFFVREIVTQSEYVFQAVHDAHNRDSDTKRFWYSVQAFLVAVGNISRILWPPDKRYVARGKDLRRILGVSDDSLLSSRTFRNHFEHFDERLESWFVLPKPPGYADQCIGPLAFLGGLDRPHYLRNFASDKGLLFFMGKSYEVASVLAEVEKVCGAARALDS